MKQSFAVGCLLTLIAFGASANYESIPPEHHFKSSSPRSTYNLAFEVDGPKGKLHLSILEDYLDFYDRSTLARYNANALFYLKGVFAQKLSMLIELIRNDRFGPRNDLPVAVVRFKDPKVHAVFAALYEHKVRFIEHTGYVQGEHNSNYSPHISIGKRGQPKEEWNDPFKDGTVRELDLSGATIFAAIENDIAVTDDMTEAEKVRVRALRRNERENLLVAGN